MTMRRLKKYLKLSLSNFLKVSPKWLQGRLVRLLFKVKLPKGIYKDIEFKIASSRDEFEQAFKLVQKSYLAMNITSDKDVMYRLNKYNILPTTTVFIAKYRGEVIATVSQITDTSLGLPVDQFADLSKLRSTGKRICEFSALAVCPKWRSRSEGVFFPLVLYAYLYCKKIIGVEYITMVTNANARYLYEHIFLFKPIDNEVKEYEYVNNAKAFAQYLEVGSSFKKYEKIFKEAKFNKNIYLMAKYFPWQEQCFFPKKKFNLSTDQKFSQEDLEYFFNHKVNLFEKLSDEDIKVLKSIYYYNNYQQVISAKQFEYATRRKSPRFQVHMKIYFKAHGVMKMANVQEVSEGGFCVVFEKEDYSPEELKGIILLSHDEDCSFEAKRCWISGNKSGYYFTAKNKKQWNKLIKYSMNVMSNQDEEELIAC